MDEVRRDRRDQRDCLPNPIEISWRFARCSTWEECQLRFVICNCAVWRDATSFSSSFSLLHVEKLLQSRQRLRRHREDTSASSRLEDRIVLLGEFVSRRLLVRWHTRSQLGKKTRSIESDNIELVVLLAFVYKKGEDDILTDRGTTVSTTVSDDIEIPAWWNMRDVMKYLTETLEKWTQYKLQ